MAPTQGSVQSGINGRIDLEFLDDVVIIRMKRGDNRLNEDFMEKMCNVLDEVERNQEIRALITTGNGRFYSNGLDVAWVNYVMANDVNGERRIRAVRQQLQKLQFRLATLPVVTVAALNGHTFAGGASLALGHDFRVMRTGRGWFCFNEVFAGVRFYQLTPVVKLKLEPNVALDTLLGRRYPAEEALRQGIVDRVCPGDELTEQSIALAREVIDRGLPSRDNLHTMKSQIYEEMKKPVPIPAKL